MKYHRLQQAAIAAFSVLTFSASAQTVSSLADLHYWGSGPNQSGLVISWNDGKTQSTLAWGFSWSGNVTAWDMLLSLATLDPRLFARIDSSTQFGPALFGLGYDGNNNGLFSVTGAVDVNGSSTNPVFISGISDMNTGVLTAEAPITSENALPTEVADHYAEGWFDNGYWEFFTGNVGAPYPTTWTSSLTGAGSTTLVNNGWYAFSIAGPYDPDIGASPSFPPGVAMPAPIPEPATWMLIAFSGLILISWQRSSHA